MDNRPIATEFQFVISTSPNAPEDHAVRKLIRRQAMKSVSTARKRAGNYGKNNLRQFPVFEQTGLNTLSKDASPGSRGSSQSSGSDVQTDWTYVDGQRSLDMITFSGSIPPNLSRKGYELMRMKYDFDILDLSSLTAIHVGRATGQVFSSDPSQLVHLLRYKQSSYFSYVPSLYGRGDCLDDAVDCVAARVRQIISPVSETWNDTVTLSYVRALSSLQKALECPSQRFKPEVLAATKILSLYELLDTSRENAWVQHVAGAAHLMQLRGPEKYHTEFEKALFIAQAGPTITESLLNNEHCFLEQDAWKAVFRSVIVKDSLIFERSEMVVSLLMLMSRMCGTFANITAVICNDVDRSPDHFTVKSLISQSRHLRADLLRWRKDYETFLTFALTLTSGCVEYGRRCTVYGIFLSCLTISNRLLAAVSGSERLALENECRLLTSKVLDLEQKVKSVSPAVTLLLALKVRVAQATVATSQDWGDVSGMESEGQENEGNVIEKWKFERWCRLFGRKT